MIRLFVIKLNIAKIHIQYINRFRTHYEYKYPKNKRPLISLVFKIKNDRIAAGYSYSFIYIFDFLIKANLIYYLLGYYTVSQT